MNMNIKKVLSIRAKLTTKIIEVYLQFINCTQQFIQSLLKTLKINLLLSFKDTFICLNSLISILILQVSNTNKFFVINFIWPPRYFTSLLRTT